MSSERYEALLPWRMPVSAAARNRSVRSSSRRRVRTNRSWPSVRGWNASATSIGTVSTPSSGPAPEPAIGTSEVAAVGSAHTRSPRASQSADPACQASRSPARRVVAWARVAGSTFAAVSRWAKGLRSFPTPIRPSAQAWSGVVPRPENGSRTTSPGREYRAMNAWARAAGKLARYEHIGWNGWPHRRCWSFHSGAMASGGSSSGSSSASWPVVARVGGPDIVDMRPH